MHVVLRQGEGMYRELPGEGGLRFLRKRILTMHQAGKARRAGGMMEKGREARRRKEAWVLKIRGQIGCRGRSLCLKISVEHDIAS